MPSIQEEPVVIYSQGQRMMGNFCLPRDGAPGVVVSHGLESSKDGDKWLVLSPRLCESGLACLRFSYRGCGEGADKSEGDFEDTTLTSRIADYRAALDFAGKKGIGSRRLGVVGSSFGGMVAIAARDERVKALVVMATPYTIPTPAPTQFKKGYIELGSGRRLPSSFFADLAPYDIGEEIKKIRCPILIIHGSRDEVVPVEEARSLYRLANEPRCLEIIEGGNHVFDNPEHLERVVALTLGWFQTYL